MTSIGEAAFTYCYNLTDVTLPLSITSVGSDAFRGCITLSNVWYSGNTADRNAINYHNGNYYLTDATWNDDDFGPAGEGLTWAYADGTLTISGSGAMPDFTGPKQVPWLTTHQEEITAVVIVPDAFPGILPLVCYFFHGLDELQIHFIHYKHRFL